MIEQSISWGNIITVVCLVLGLIINGFVNAAAVGRYFGAFDRRMENVDKRLEVLETVGAKITDLLVTLAQQKGEMNLITRRLDDLQVHGSHKLAEILEGVRQQIMTEVRERYGWRERERERERERRD